MKTIKYLAIIIAFLASFSVSAICPTQQATIFFANGVNVDRDGVGGAEDSKDRLKHELLSSGVTKGCVKFLVAYNTNEPTYVADFVEAFIQKSAEFTGVDNFPWAQWQNTISTTDWFLQVVEKFVSIPARILIESERWVLGDQRDEHVLVYQAEMALGRKVILAAHSQGTLNAKEERLALSPTEQLNTKIVGAAAFSFPEPDESRYTTTDEDKLAVGGLGLPSPPANIFLTLGDSLACQPAVPNPWYCHEFIRSYMGIAPARDKIVGDIIALLPTPVETGLLQGYTYRLLFDGSATVIEGGATVHLRDYDTGTILSEAESDTNGFYSFTAPACAHCSIDASKFIPSDGVTYNGSLDDFEIIPGVTYNLDVTMFPPPVGN